MLYCWVPGSAAQASANSLTISGLADNDDGRSIDLRGRYAPIESLVLGAGVGHSRSKLDGDAEELAGTTFGVVADLDIHSFFINATADRWKDSGTLRSTALHGELGWMSEGGIAIAALVTNHAMRVTYTNTLLGQARERNIDYSGTGFGADVSYYGEAWTAGLRFLDYDYGANVERARAVLNSSNTSRFPRLQQLFGSMATQAAGAPDREASAVLGRQFTHWSLTADVQWQRDALTADKTRGAGLTLGLMPGKHFDINVGAGVNKGGDAGTVPWASLSLTLHDAK